MKNVLTRKNQFLILSLEALKFSKNFFSLVNSNSFYLEIKKKFLELSTIEFFTSEACSFPQHKILNKFDILKNKWIKKLEKYEEFENFHECIIPIALEFGVAISFEGENKNFPSSPKISTLR